MFLVSYRMTTLTKNFSAGGICNLLILWLQVKRAAVDLIISLGSTTVKPAVCPLTDENPLFCGCWRLYDFEANVKGTVGIIKLQIELLYGKAYME